MACACLMICWLAGCGGENQDNWTMKNSNAGATSMEGTPIVDYTVPQLYPNIMVDRHAYSVGDEKAAAVKGSRLPKEFGLRDAATGEVVYTAELTNVVYNEELHLYVGYAYFSGFDEEGTYYLECDIVGRSYSFDIEKDSHRQLFEALCGELMEDCRDRKLTVAEAVSLLAAYEWYGSLFSDDDKSGAPDVLEALKVWAAYMEEKNTEVQREALYAAFLAKFGYLYQKYDRQYATDCLKRASTVFGLAQNAVGRDADSFFALTELYRATGMSTYGNQILDYKTFFQNNSSYMEEKSYLYGSMTYLATRQQVDVDLCTVFMEAVMDRGEEISKRYQEIIHPVTAKNNGSADLLKQAMELSCANYVLNNYHYTNIIEEFLHYLMGRNPESADFYGTDEDRLSYLLLLAQLAANHLKTAETK